MIQSFRDLKVWQKGMVLAEHVYAASESLPRNEFEFKAQIRRASVSIPSNVAEGKALGGKGYMRHLRIALGSEAELQTQIELSARLNLLNQHQADALLIECAEVGRMLSGLLKALARAPHRIA
ncbi:MAG TPA: four helix bundle protein [Vicinamibacterales bacterium]